jgi:transposase-like protein
MQRIVLDGLLRWYRIWFMLCLGGAHMKLRPGATPKERERYWTQVIEEGRNYPSGIQAFCKKKGVSKNSYYVWFKKLLAAHPEWQGTEGRAVKGVAKLPKTEVTEKASRRRFTAKDKARVLGEIDNAAPGQVAAILRREGIYTSYVHKWRLERAERNLEARKRGPKPNAAAAEIKKLKAQLARSEKMLARANAMIELQKKVAEILGTSLESEEED